MDSSIMMSIQCAASMKVLDEGLKIKQANDTTPVKIFGEILCAVLVTISQKVHCSRATKILKKLKLHSYEKMLKGMGLFSIEKRLLKGNMIEVYLKKNRTQVHPMKLMGVDSGWTQ